MKNSSKEVDLGRRRVIPLSVLALIGTQTAAAEVVKSVFSELENLDQTELEKLIGELRIIIGERDILLQGEKEIQVKIDKLETELNSNESLKRNLENFLGNRYPGSDAYADKHDLPRNPENILGEKYSNFDFLYDMRVTKSESLFKEDPNHKSIYSLHLKLKNMVGEVQDIIDKAAQSDFGIPWEYTKKIHERAKLKKDLLKTRNENSAVLYDIKRRMKGIERKLFPLINEQELVRAEAARVEAEKNLEQKLGKPIPEEYHFSWGDSFGKKELKHPSLIDIAKEQTPEILSLYRKMLVAEYLKNILEAQKEQGEHLPVQYLKEILIGGSLVGIKTRTREEHEVNLPDLAWTITHVFDGNIKGEKGGLTTEFLDAMDQVAEKLPQKY